MGVFDVVKKNNAITMEKELPNKDLLYISYDKNIPSVNRGLSISIKIDLDGNFLIEDESKEVPDPSTIYFHLPVKDDQYVEKLPYWPHYIELTPSQRFRYLSWLRNVEQPTDMGFVFLYYYGLERQLLIGDFDKSFDEIIKLRNAHENKSFHNYSENALVHAAIIRDRTDSLTDLHKKTRISGYSNAMFLLAYNDGLDLGEEQLILIFHKAFTISRKVVKENRSLFIDCLKDTLSQKFGKSSFAIKDYNIENVNTVKEIRFANYSFPEDIQYVEITNFYQCKSLMQDLKSVHDEAYSLYKTKKQLLKSNKTPEEMELAMKKRNENRYKKLLKEKRLTDFEFQVLQDLNEGRIKINKDSSSQNG